MPASGESVEAIFFESHSQYSIAFFQELGVDYVSCTAYRVPVARLAAAQAAIACLKTR